jgi:kumamolisin
VAEHFVDLPGSERLELPGSTRIGVTRPQDRFAVSIVVRPAARRDHDPITASIGGAQQLAPEDLASAFGPAESDVAAVLGFADRVGLVLEGVIPVARTVRVSGTASQYERAFGVALADYEYQGTTFRGRTGTINVPGDLSEIVTAVFGLDTRPVGRHVAAVPVPIGEALSPLQVKSAYRFPAQVDGRGQCIGFIELGGGYRPSDIDTHLANLGGRAPHVVEVGVGAAFNAPTAGPPNNPCDPDLEVALDLQVAAAAAPGATIAVYFAANTSQGFLDAVTAAVTDVVRRPSVLAICWSAAEEEGFITAALARAADELFRVAGSCGITVLSASGRADAGSSQSPFSGAFPAVSPNVTACTGTRLFVSEGGIQAEQLWEARPGAEEVATSRLFALPRWQSSLAASVAREQQPLTGRLTPDVAAHAAGYLVTVRGVNRSAAGLGAATSLWAGLVALLNHSLDQRVGWLNPHLYGPILAAGGYRPVLSGPGIGGAPPSGWQPALGLGSPHGLTMLRALRSSGDTSETGAKPLPSLPDNKLAADTHPGASPNMSPGPQTRKERAMISAPGAAPPTAPIQPKPGPQTTEFWQTTLTSVISFAIAIGALFNVHWDPTGLRALVPALALVASGLATALYTFSRAHVKAAAHAASAQVLAAYASQTAPPPTGCKATDARDGDDRSSAQGPGAGPARAVK